MLRLRRLALVALVLSLATGLAGCGLGAGEGGIDARVVVTRDFGARQLEARIAQDLPSSETAMRLLERSFDVETRYGGGFVQSIDGVAGGREDGRPVDWFFYVNGVESEVGAGDVDAARRRPRLVGSPRLGRRAAHPGCRRLVPRAVRARRRRQALPARARVRGGCRAGVRDRFRGDSPRSARLPAARRSAPASAREPCACSSAAGSTCATTMRSRRSIGGRRRAASSRTSSSTEERSSCSTRRATRSARSTREPASSPPPASRTRRRRGRSPGVDDAGLAAAARALDERTLRNRFAIAIAADGRGETVYPLPTVQ